MTYDLLIEGEIVIDPSQGLNAVMDVAISGKRITKLDVGMVAGRAAQMLKADGLMVVPELMDLRVQSNSGASY